MRKVGRFMAFAASAMLLSVIALLPLASRAEETARQKTTGYPAVVVHGLADARDDLDGGLEELVLGLWMLVVARLDVPVGLGEFTEDLAGPAAQVPCLEVDELQLPLHAQAGSR